MSTTVIPGPCYFGKDQLVVGMALTIGLRRGDLGREKGVSGCRKEKDDSKQKSQERKAEIN